MAFFRGFGSYLPERVVTNDELAAACGTTSDWILSACGIRERRYAADAQTVTALGTLAAENCLQTCGLKASDLGAILVSSGSPDRYCPGPAASIAHALGLSSTLALDIPVASAGSLIGLALADSLAAPMGPVLVVATEIMSRRVERTPDGRNTAILFGDGAGAALIDPQAGFARIAGHELHTDGAAAEILSMEHDRLHMDGGSVILQAARKLPAVLRSLLVREGVTPETVGHVVMHQANLNLMQKVAKSSGIAFDRFFVNIDRYGNTSSASLLIAADEWRLEHPEPLTAPLVFAAFGSGLNWGALLSNPA